MVRNAMGVKKVGTPLIITAPVSMDMNGLCT